MPRIRQYNRCGMRHRWSTRHSHGHEGQSESHEYCGNEPKQRQATGPLTGVGLACLYFGPPCPHVALIPLSRKSLSHSSDEHTSELQSLKRITYAVLCLK